MQQNPMNMLMQMLSMGNNPQQIIQNLAAQNPQVQAVFNQMQQSGMTPQQYAMQYAKQNNINIQPFVNMMNQRGIRL
jgi:ABC-type proline/glycine betaine transport system substrate-binding protein